jgi:hypothetical protein
MDYNPGVEAGRRYLEVPSGAADMAEGSGKMAAARPDSGGVGEEEGADKWGRHVSDSKKRKRFGEKGVI